MRWKTQFLKLGPQTLYNFLGVVTFSTIEQTMHDFVGGITSTTIGIGILLGIINFKHFYNNRYCNPFRYHEF